MSIKSSVFLQLITQCLPILFNSQRTKYDTNFVFPTMPDELLLKIFSYLGSADLVRVRNVNRLFNRIGSDDALWEKKYHQLVSDVFTDLLVNQSGYKRQFFESILLLKNIEMNILTAKSRNRKISSLNGTKIQCMQNTLLMISENRKILKKEPHEQDFSLFFKSEHLLFALLVDKNRFFTSGTNTGVFLWSLEQKDPVHYFETGSERIHCLAVANGFLYGGSNKGTLFKWDLATKELCARPAYPTSLSFSKIAVHNQKVVIMGKDERWVLIVDDSDFCNWERLDLEEFCYKDFALHQDYLFTSTCNGEIRARSLSNLKDTHKFSFRIEPLALKHRLRCYGGFLFSYTSQTGCIDVWCLKTQKWKYNIHGWKSGDISDFYISDGELFVSSSEGLYGVNFK